MKYICNITLTRSIKLPSSKTVLYKASSGSLQVPLMWHYVSASTLHTIFHQKRDAI